MATHFHQLAIKDIRRETADCISIAFDIPTHLKQIFTFTQGQNITIKAAIAGETLRRSYSICSSPMEDELRIAVKKVADGKFSSWASEHLKKGSELTILPPTGKFYTPLDARNKKNYMAFAAGSGITPLLSIIKTSLQTEPGSSFTLVYGNKNRTSIIFKEELEALKNKYIHRFSIHHIFSREKADAPIYHGRIDAAKCETIFQHLINIKNCDAFFLCGPESMIFTVKDYLEAKGVDKTQIHFELFTPPGQVKSLVATGGPLIAENVFQGKASKVNILLDGVSFGFDLSYNGQSILDAALATGADLPYACKGGVCASCRAKLVSGEVMMDNNYALEPDELNNGYILTCQSHPRSEKISIDFDQK
ncbi:MAG: 1,2-phenylacetyl-CoA epoxidase subunit PaaE [Chitinophagaceae bacterium]